jgi:hypothetical protein
MIATMRIECKHDAYFAISGARSGVNGFRHHNEGQQLFCSPSLAAIRFFWFMVFYFVSEEKISGIYCNVLVAEFRFCHFRCLVLLQEALSVTTWEFIVTKALGFKESEIF